MESESLVAEFRQELPFYLRCSEVTADKSAFQMRAYFKGNPGSFPDNFTRQTVIAWLRLKATTPPYRRPKARREPSTINDILKSLRRFSRWCVARGYLESDVTDGIRGLVERDRVIFAPDDADMLKLVLASRDHGESEELKRRNHALCMFMTDAGPRSAEVLAMDLLDVYDGKNVRPSVKLKGKGGKERLVGLIDEVRDALCRYMELRRPSPNETALWLDHYGERMSYTALRNMVRALTGEIGLKIALHDFRRYSHTSLWIKGIDQIDGMTLSGHSDHRVYQRYIQAGMQKRAVEQQVKLSPLKGLLEVAD